MIVTNCQGRGGKPGTSHYLDADTDYGFTIQHCSGLKIEGILDTKANITYLPFGFVSAMIGIG